MMKKVQLWATGLEAQTIQDRLDLYFTEKKAECEGELIDAKRDFKKFVLSNEMYKMKNAFAIILSAKNQLISLEKMKEYLDSEEDVKVEQKSIA